MASNSSLGAATAALQHAKKQLMESLGDSEPEYEFVYVFRIRPKPIDCVYIALHFSPVAGR